MIANTGFPEYIESIAIGPNRDFLKTNTSLCDIAEDFEIELELAYKWKNVTTSYLVLPELREYVKYLTINGPELDTESLVYFSDKINKVPSRYKYKVLDELEEAFNGGNKLNPITADKDFLSKLADLLKNCDSPCNYFRAYGDSIGTIFDISRNNNTNTEPSSVDESRPPATHVGMNIFNKMHTAIRDSYAEMCARAGAVWDDIKSDKPSIVRSDTDAYTSITNIYSDTLSKVKRRTQDCFRLYDYNNRYNAYNPDMNLGVARNKYFDIVLQVGNLHTTKKKYRISVSGDTDTQNEPVTTAVNALGFKNLNKKHDDRVFNINPETDRRKIGKGAIRFTTYGEYDKNPGESGGDTNTNAKKGKADIDLTASYSDGNKGNIQLVALSDTAREALGIAREDVGQVFTLSDSRGTTATYMYVDYSPQSDFNIDLYDSRSGSMKESIRTEAYEYFIVNRDKDTNKEISRGDRNVEELIYTKLYVEENLVKIK